MDAPVRLQKTPDEVGDIAIPAPSVYEQLLSDILTGVFAPGRRLKIHRLTKRYEVGSGPLREALNRLSANGMVVRETNKGFHVSPTSIDELQELIRTRRWLEEIALRKSIEAEGAL